MKNLLYITLTLFLVFSFFGCQTNDILQGISTNSMNEKDTQENQDIPFCKVGDILNPGQSCLDKGTDATFTVLDNGNAKYTSESGLLYESTDLLNTTGTTLNNQSYDFIARKRNDGSWIIERED